MYYTTSSTFARGRRSPFSEFRGRKLAGELLLGGDSQDEVQHTVGVTL